MKKVNFNSKIKTINLNYMKHNSQKRIYFEGAEYFVTNHTKNWVKFFKEPIFCGVFIANLRLCKVMHDFSLYAFVVLLHHFHLQFMPENAKDLPKIMQFLKRHVTRHINFILGYETEEAICKSLLRLSEGEVLKSKKDKILNISKLNKNLNPKQNKYQIYKELIAEHYTYLKQLRRQFVKKYGDNLKFPRFRWEKSYRDHYIRNHRDFDEHVKYIYNNPFKHKIPAAENYKYIFTNYPELITEI
ncbi:MAG: hypothetical protein NTX00_05565 [Candidatus Parcubacteria bacterium]|nr:hypothetical protein [Candidatus Parcubacteria bacterium]